MPTVLPYFFYVEFKRVHLNLYYAAKEIKKIRDIVSLRGVLLPVL